MSDGVLAVGLEGVMKLSTVIQRTPEAVRSMGFAFGTCLGCWGKRQVVTLEMQNYFSREMTKSIARRCRGQLSAWKVVAGAPVGHTGEWTCLRGSRICRGTSGHGPETGPSGHMPALRSSHTPGESWRILQYWGGLPFMSPGDLPDPGTEPASPGLPRWR